MCCCVCARCLEAGVPGYAEVERDADMSVDKLRARYPDLVICTNVSPGLLRLGTRDQVYADSLRILAESQGRGYLHGPSNAILPGTPVENVITMTQARMEFARGGQRQASG